MARRRPFVDRMLAAITEGDRRHLPELRRYCAVIGAGAGLLAGYLLGGLYGAPVAALVLGAGAFYALPMVLHMGIWALGWTVILGGVALVAGAIWWAVGRWVA